MWRASADEVDVTDAKRRSMLLHVSQSSRLEGCVEKSQDEITGWFSGLVQLVILPKVNIMM